jgi:hypothetical protein
MTTKQQYNYEYLQFCEENSITLSKDYSQNTKIEGKCKIFRKLTITYGFIKKYDFKY